MMPSLSKSCAATDPKTCECSRRPAPRFGRSGHRQHSDTVLETVASHAAIIASVQSAQKRGIDSRIREQADGNAGSHQHRDDRSSRLLASTHLGQVEASDAPSAPSSESEISSGVLGLLVRRMVRPRHFSDWLVSTARKPTQPGGPVSERSVSRTTAPKQVNRQKIK